MNSRKKSLIMFASWEDRFPKGFSSNINTASISEVRIFYLKEFADWTRHNRGFVKKLCIDKSINHKDIQLSSHETANNWNLVNDEIKALSEKSEDVLLDISTMPREVIWTLLWFLQLYSRDINYVYHRPEEYSTEWLSRDPGRPRLVFKMSGSPRFDARTALVITAGYDLQRAKQLVKWYEPEKILIGLQSGTHFKNNEDKMAEFRREFESEYECELIEIDACSSDHGQSKIESYIQTIIPTHNVIMASLGPKLTAIALYNIQRKYLEVGLTYAPSNEFNQEYSHGIGECYTGEIKPVEIAMS